MYNWGVHFIEVITMQAINFTTARNELAAVLDGVSGGEPIMITRRSAKPVIVIDAEQYEKMQKIQAESDFDWLFTEHGQTLEALKNR
nr:type II toxin-antitoxin system Phd/YefM family antitoxin [Rahnella perminowiae]